MEQNQQQRHNATVPGYYQQPVIYQGGTHVNRAGYGMHPYVMGYPSEEYLINAANLKRAGALYGDDQSANNILADALNSDVDDGRYVDPIHVYKTDDITVFKVIIVGFFALFLAVSIVGISTDFYQGKMPQRWQNWLFQRPYPSANR